MIGPDYKQNYHTVCEVQTIRELSLGKTMQGSTSSCLKIEPWTAINLSDAYFQDLEMGSLVQGQC
jgi:hypothetical protein